MNSPDAGTQSEALPLRSSLTPLYVASLAIAMVMLFASVIGLVYQRLFYGSNVLRIAFAPSDAAGLVIGLPVLLGSMWLARRGRLIGLLCWPGALFYALYVYVPYVIAVPFNMLFPLHLILVVLSGYSLIGLVSAIDGEAVGRQLAGQPSLRVSAIILMAFGIFIMFRQTVVIIGALAGQASVGVVERSTWIADSAIVPMLLGSGLLLWRRRPLGYASGAGLLLGYGMLALGLIPYFLVQSRITGRPVDSAGVIIVLAMAAVCLIPWALLMRAAHDRAAA